MTLVDKFFDATSLVNRKISSSSPLVIDPSSLTIDWFSGAAWLVFDSSSIAIGSFSDLP